MNLFRGILISVFLSAVNLYSQEQYFLEGVVSDHHNEPLQGATIFLDRVNSGVISDGSGSYRIDGIPGGSHILQVRYVGYETFLDTLQLFENRKFNVHLTPSFLDLQEVVVTDHSNHRARAEQSMNIELVDESFIAQNLEGSLSQTLARLPGVQAMRIGSGQAKPVIRGMGLNRVVVAENGIKHEGQQWGSDHGLEIDQFAADRIEVVKGPSSLLYGSDAIGGVISLEKRKTPAVNTVQGDIGFIGMSNNSGFGSSARVDYRKESFTFGMQGTLLNYADFKVPADSADIYSYRVPLLNGRVRNTAGMERNLHLNAGYLSEPFTLKLFVSRVEQAQGFFAHAHGLEPRNVDIVMHDRSPRDMLYPRQDSEHWKAILRASYRTGQLSIESDLGYQNNLRNEWSEYTSHGFMPPIFPDSLGMDSDLERSFKKQSLDGTVRLKWELQGRGEFISGVSSAIHLNRIGGRGFIIPAYNSQSAGAFSYMKWFLSTTTILHLGARFDRGMIDSEPYTDWYTSPVESATETERQFLERAKAIDRTFNNLSWSIGMNHNRDHLHLKVNAGKSFRMPLAKELAANGVNYHFYRFEVGNPNLDPEESYQLDAGLEWHGSKFAVGVTPFANYYANYIYLNPDFQFDRLYGNGNQIFNYAQTSAFRMGGEVHAHYRPLGQLQFGLIGEYLYAVQLSGDKRGYTLPFSPPPSLLFNVRLIEIDAWKLSGLTLNLDVKKVFRQDMVVPPEEKTAGYTLLNFGAGTEVQVGDQPLKLNLKISNILNRNYQDHTSYYRLIGLPEQGRNISLHLVIPFKYSTVK